MLAGKAQLESGGSLCANRIRQDEYWKGSPTMGWEGTAYWSCYPDWYTKILLWWHPAFGGAA